MNPIPVRTTPSRRRSRRGATLVDMLTAVFILSLITTAVLGLTATANRTADRRTLENSMGSYARASLDEILRELRAAQEIAAGQTIGGMTYNTGPNNIVFWAPRYNASGTLAEPPDLNSDAVAFAYDPQARILRETTSVSSGSIRPARTNLAVAKHVANVAYTYRVREYLVVEGSKTATVSQSTFPLRTQSATMPQVYVGGRSTPAALTGAAPSTTVTLQNPVVVPAADPPGRVAVQILYTVNPTTNPAGLEHVNGVDVTLTLSEMDGRRITRTVRLSGNARLRNKRT